MVWKVLATVVLAGAAIAVVLSLPDVRRYLRLRRM